MCIGNTTKTVADLRQLASEIESRFSLDPKSEACDKSTQETCQPNSDFDKLLTEVVNSLLGAVILKEVPVDPSNTRPDLKGMTYPRVDCMDYDAVAHSVYNI